MNEIERKGSSFERIAKAITLFAGVKAFNIVIKIIQGKLAAIILGTKGVGQIGIYNTTMFLIQSGCSLGIPKSAVRDVAEKSYREDLTITKKGMFVNNIVNELSYITGLIGLIITCLLAFPISKTSFGDSKHIVFICFLGIAVFFEMVSEGQIAILKGMQRLKGIARVYTTGCLLGLLTSIPLYYFFKEKGIVFAFIFTTGSIFLESTFQTRKIQKYSAIPFRLLWKHSKNIIKVGIVLMLTSITINITNYMIVSFIRREGGLEIVGFYTVGYTIIYGYFSVISTAMVTDYYPRVAMIYNNDKEIIKEMNRQILVQILLILPFLISFMVFAKYIILLLYAHSFLSCVSYIKVSFFGAFLNTCTSPIELILVAKQKTRPYLFMTLALRTLQLVLYFTFYKIYSLNGIGIACMILGMIQFLAYAVYIKMKYGITIQKKNILMISFTMALMAIAYSLSYINTTYIFLSTAIIIVLSSLALSIYLLKKMLNIKLKRILGYREIKSHTCIR